MAAAARATAAAKGGLPQGKQRTIARLAEREPAHRSARKGSSKASSKASGKVAQPAAKCADGPPAGRGGGEQRTAASAMTIGRLAQAAEVGVETVRYYQRRGLLPQPKATGGAYRHYPPEVAARLRFIRRAQQLGFTLEEIASLLQLSDGTDRRSIRRITAARLAQLQERMADMARMAAVLQHLLHACEHTSRATRCPIIESIGAMPLAARDGASA